MQHTPKVESDSIAEVNQVINAYFERSIMAASAIGESYEQLWVALYKLFRSGGKRIRPQLTILSYEAFGGTDRSMIIPIASAQELLHQSLLVHDDIIDRDYVRYGVPNIAGQYDTKYSLFVDNKVERIHYASSAALLGGNLLLSGAYQMIASANASNSEKIIAQQLLSQSIFEVAGGELRDTELAFMPSVPGDALIVAQYKTASYSFVGPLLTGARLAGANEDQQEKIEAFATSLGIAYQLVDDLLGVFGNEEETGKSTSSDILEGKHTFMVEQCLQKLQGKELEIFSASFGNADATEATIVKVKELFVKSGAKAMAQQKIAEYTNIARENLHTLALNERYMAQFEAFITKVTKRAS